MSAHLRPYGRRVVPPSLPDESVIKKMIQQAAAAAQTPLILSSPVMVESIAAASLPSMSSSGSESIRADGEYSPRLSGAESASCNKGH